MATATATAMVVEKRTIYMYTQPRATTNSKWRQLMAAKHKNHSPWLYFL